VPQQGDIVVVEPDDLILGLLERWLGEAGYAVVVKGLPKRPRGHGDGGSPDLVIVDVPAPRSAERIVRSVKEVYGSPILLLSARLGRGANASSDVARQLGVSKVLPKPFTQAELLAAVGELIDRR
jgi:DNA-binding response OmpR family regulator